MIKCSKCNEMIGDDISDCPFCKHHITEEERRTALAENEVLHEAAVQRAMEEYRHRFKLGIIVSIILGLIIVAGAIFISLSDVYVIGIICLILVVFGIYFACVVKLRIGMCPYCESMITGHFLFISHCPRCGGRLR